MHVLITGGAIDQGVVLASIVAGFSLSTAIQIAMGSNTHQGTTRIIYVLFVSAMCCMASVAASMARIAAPDATDKWLLSQAFVLLLYVGGALFMLGFVGVIGLHVAKMNPGKEDSQLPRSPIGIYGAIIGFFMLLVVIFYLVAAY